MKITKETKLLLVAICAFVVCVISTVSYAHFTATLTGVSRATVLTTGYLEITYIDGSVIGSTSNMLPGQYVEKSFSVQNTGTVDMYYSINLNDVINTFATKEDLVCELIDGSGTTVAQAACPVVNQAIKRHISLPAGSTHNYTLRVTFDETGVNQDDNKGKIFSAKIGLSEDTKPLYTIVSGDLDTIGSVVKIANEEFYVIGQEDDEHVKLLSKWNLNVGNSAKGIATNLQDEDVRGYSYNGAKYGNVPFSSSSYWYDSVNGRINNEYVNLYAKYVYTNNKDNGVYIASIAEYVDNYVNYLNSQGVIATGRLISYQELQDLGCQINNICNTSRPWLYQTTYWVGNAYDSLIYRVYNFNSLTYRDSGTEHNFGVRPVIILER